MFQRNLYSHQSLEFTKSLYLHMSMIGQVGDLIRFWDMIVIDWDGLGYIRTYSSDEDSIKS